MNVESRSSAKLLSSSSFSSIVRGLYRVRWYLWGLGLCLLLGIYWFPIRFGSLRLLIVLLMVALWGGAAALAWRSIVMRLVLLLTLVVLLIIAVAPLRQLNRPFLQKAYLNGLNSYRGTLYVWGGENGRGIDCSGLVRRGFIDATFSVGMRTLNPALIRRSAELWWFDCSANAMKGEYRHQMRFVQLAASLNTLDYRTIRAGDVAVTDSGVHTLAYIGDRTWIEADPGAWQVIAVQAPSRNAWFNQPMHIMRWRELDDV